MFWASGHQHKPDACDNDLVRHLSIQVTLTGALPVFRSFRVASAPRRMRRTWPRRLWRAVTQGVDEGPAFVAVYRDLKGSCKGDIDIDVD